MADHGAGHRGDTGESTLPPTAESEEGAVNAVNAEHKVSDGPRHTGTLAARLLVNVLVALPFFGVGGAGLVRGDLPNNASLVVIVIGALVVLVGLYVTVLSRPRLNLMPNEETLALRHPSMKPAFARIVISVPFFLGAGYLLQFTAVPYVYPFVPFLFGMYMYFRGVIKYWVNHHTTYYVTSRRAVHMYRFIWLDTTEIPVNAINSISETRGFIETLTGRGSVLVASGIGARHKVRMGEIDNPGPVAASLRQLVP